MITERELERYYKMREERKAHVEQNAKPRKNRDQRDRLKEASRYWEKYDHKQVKVKLINGEELQGKLHVDWKCPYDVQLEMEDGKRILIPKHSILYVTEA